MKKNVNVSDKIVRLLLAVVLAIVLFTGTITGVVAAIAGIAAFLLAATALINFCPIYYALGISTVKKKHA